MSKIIFLENYNLILIRYSGEIWLKSTKVKMRMLKRLVRNIKEILNRSGIVFNKYQLSKDSSRIFYFFKNKDIPEALEILKKIFGIYSFSPALRTSNKLNNIIERTLEVARNVLKKDDSFALRVKRSGNHEYSSQEIAVKGGQAIMDTFKDLNLKVNLSNPQKRIFIEVRGDFTYLFTEIIKSDWCGLPLEITKKILCMDIGRLSDLLSGFLLMKRGCVISPILFNLTEKDDFNEQWMSNWKEVAMFLPDVEFIVKKINLFKILKEIISVLNDKSYICAICRLLRWDILSKMFKEFDIEDFKKKKPNAITDGINLNQRTSCNDYIDLESISLNYMFSEHPIFTPLIGLNSKNIDDLIEKISKNIRGFKFCQLKPKDQQIDSTKLKKLYKSLNLTDLIEKSLEEIEEFKII